MVIQIKDRRIELYADGLPVKIATADPNPDTIDVFLTFGFAHIKGGNPQSQALPGRFLIGRMAEIAIYDRVLTPGEIRERGEK